MQTFLVSCHLGKMIRSALHEVCFLELFPFYFCFGIAALCWWSSLHLTEHQVIGDMPIEGNP